MKYLLVSLLLFSNNLISQQDTIEKIFKQYRIGVNIGGSSAQENYGKTGLEDGAGFAEGGQSLWFSFEYKFQKNKAATFIYGSTRNGFAGVSYASALDAFDQSDTVIWNAAGDNYKVGFGLVGIKFMYGNTTRLYFNPMLGIGSMRSPEVKVRATTISGVVVDQKVRESNPETAIMLGVSGGLDIDLSDMVSLNFNILYLVSEFELTQELETFDTNGPIIRTESGDQPYSTLNISVGLGINF